MAKKYRYKVKRRREREYVPDHVAEGTANSYGVFDIRVHSGTGERMVKALRAIGLGPRRYLHMGVREARQELLELEARYNPRDETLRHIRRQINGARIRRKGYGIAAAVAGFTFMATPVTNLLEGNGLSMTPVHGTQFADAGHLLGGFLDNVGIIGKAHAALPSVELPSIELPNIGLPSLDLPSTERLSAEDVALITAAQDATGVVAQFRYTANTGNGDRVSASTLQELGAAGVTAQGDVVTNNDPYVVIGGTFTATSILRDHGLLRADGVLINMSASHFAGEMVGKSQLESGLSPTVEATHGDTLDGALGAFQIKPSTAFSVLAMDGYRLQRIPGLVDDHFEEIIQRGMRLLADSPQLNGSDMPDHVRFRTRHNIRTDHVRDARRTAAGYDFNNPGAAANHSNLFYAAFELLPDEDKQYIRSRLIETDQQVEHGNFSGAQGVVLSGVIAGMLADQLDISQELVDRYGFRPFGYIGHQAGPRALNRIVDNLEDRDMHPVGSVGWRRADAALRATILAATNIRSNYPVYTTARAPRTFTAGDIIPWSGLQPNGEGRPNIVDGISAKYGVTAGVDLPQAAADIYEAVNQGLLRMQRADYSGQGAFASIALVESPNRGGRPRQQMAQDFRPGERAN